MRIYTARWDFGFMIGFATRVRPGGRSRVVHIRGGHEGIRAGRRPRFTPARRATARRMLQAWQRTALTPSAVWRRKGRP